MRCAVNPHVIPLYPPGPDVQACESGPDVQACESFMHQRNDICVRMRVRYHQLIRKPQFGSNKANMKEVDDFSRRSVYFCEILAWWLWHGSFCSAIINATVVYKCNL
jgi:hypothetical protein